MLRTPHLDNHSTTDCKPKFRSAVYTRNIEFDRMEECTQQGSCACAQQSRLDYYTKCPNHIPAHKFADLEKAGSVEAVVVVVTLVEVGGSGGSGTYGQFVGNPTILRTL